MNQMLSKVQWVHVILFRQQLLSLISLTGLKICLLIKIKPKVELMRLSCISEENLGSKLLMMNYSFSKKKAKYNQFFQQKDLLAQCG